MPGELSPSNILQLRVKAENAWSDAKTKDQYIIESKAAQAVLANQTARVDLLRGQANKDQKVEITFLNTCGITDDSCTDNCTLDEPELDSGRKEYEITSCRKSGFSIDEEKIRTNSYELEEQYQAGHRAAVKALDEYWAARTVAALTAEAGHNAYPAPYLFDATNMVTNVPADQYNLRQLTANLIIQAQRNYITNPYYIESGLLLPDYLNVQFNAGNFDGKGDQARLNSLNRFYFDPINFGKANVTTANLLMVDPSAAAIVTKNRHERTPRVLGGKIGQTLYTVPSLTLPGIEYDVYYELSCKTVNGNSHYFHTWRYETRGELFFNPALCPITVGGSTVQANGILAYRQVAG